MIPARTSARFVMPARSRLRVAILPFLCGEEKFGTELLRDSESAFDVRPKLWRNGHDPQPGRMGAVTIKN